MNWKIFWNEAGKNTDALTQVQRFNSKNPEIISQTAIRIIELLSISNKDDVLDVCCGNGLITKEISTHCNSITGVDFSDSLLDFANKNSAGDTIIYSKQDALNLSFANKFDKAYLAFSFQYFESYEHGKKAIENILMHLKPGGKLLLTDLPDKSRWGNFYNSLPKKLFYLKQKLFGNEPMGKFWSETELNKICQELNLKGSKISQTKEMPYSYYRFDWMIETN